MKQFPGKTRSLLLLLWFLCWTPLVGRAESGAKEPNSSKKSAEIVAEINGFPITAEALDKELKLQLGFELANFQPGERHFILGQLLEQMAKRRLLLQQAESWGLAPKDTEVTAAVKELRRKHPGQGFPDTSGDLNASAELVHSVRDDLSIRRYLKAVVFSNITVAESELRSAYQKEVETFSRPEEVRLRHILIRLKPSASKEKKVLAEKRAQVIKTRLESAAISFEEAARTYSDAPNAGKGGDLGFVTENQLDEAISRAAFDLRPGAVSEVIRTEEGLHLVQVEERLQAKPRSYAEVKKQLKERLLKEKRKERLRNHLLELTRKGKVIPYLD